MHSSRERRSPCIAVSVGPNLSSWLEAATAFVGYLSQPIGMWLWGCSFLVFHCLPATEASAEARQEEGAESQFFECRIKTRMCRSRSKTSLSVSSLSECRMPKQDKNSAGCSWWVCSKMYWEWDSPRFCGWWACSKMYWEWDSPRFWDWWVHSKP